MTAAEVLKQLEAQGVQASLNLKLKAEAKPSDETLSLITANREALITHLAKQRGLILYGDLLASLMVWTSQHHTMNCAFYKDREGVAFNATADFIADKLQSSAWAVVSDKQGVTLATVGNVPAHVFQGKTFLEPTKENGLEPVFEAAS
jgi:hypothetical protein